MMAPVRVAPVVRARAVATHAAEVKAYETVEKVRHRHRITAVTVTC